LNYQSRHNRDTYYSVQIGSSELWVIRAGVLESGHSYRDMVIE